MPRRMKLGRTVGLWTLGWGLTITVLHGTLNLRWLQTFGAAEAANQERYRVGFLPVTCHLTCPVTDFINKQLVGHGL